MAYFPVFIQLDGEEVLLVGGGKIALGKASRLIEYGVSLRVVALTVLPELEALPRVTVERRPFKAEDLDGDYAFVIAATDSRSVNHEISRLCRERDILVNVVDTPEDCSFLFPALVHRGPLSIGISTSGASPSGAVYVKQEINRLLPESMEEILSWLDSLRPAVKAQIKEEERRKQIFGRLFSESLRKNRPLTEAETKTLLKQIR